jgi:DNA primase
MLTPAEIRARLDARKLFGPVPPDDRAIYTRCLWHQDSGRPNLAVYRDHCYCYRCGASEGSLGLLAALRGLDIRRDFAKVCAEAEALIDAEEGVVLKTEDKKLDPLPLSIVESYHRSLLANPKCQQWLFARGIPIEAIIQERIGHSGKAFTIPVWDDDHHNVLTIRFRRDDTVTTSGPKYWGIFGRNGTLLYNAHLLKSQLNKPIILCEGELDALLLASYGERAVSQTNGNRADILERLRGFDDVVVAYDQDSASWFRAFEVAAKLNANVLRWHPKNGKDVTEYVQKNGIDSFRRLVEYARGQRRCARF